jgi:DNA topoisomerase IB
VLKRIKALAIRPAWTDVWMQTATFRRPGATRRGRKQHRYHALFREVRERTKYEHVVAFADGLPAIREKVQEHLALRDCRAKRYWRPSSTFWRPRSSASETTNMQSGTTAMG